MIIQRDKTKTGNISETVNPDNVMSHRKPINKINPLDLIKAALPNCIYFNGSMKQMLLELFVESYGNASKAAEAAKNKTGIESVKSYLEIINGFKNKIKSISTDARRLENTQFLVTISDVVIRATAAGIETASLLTGSSHIAETTASILESKGWSKEKILAAKMIADVKNFAKSMIKVIAEKRGHTIAALLMTSLITVAEPSLSEAFIKIDMSNVAQTVQNEISEAISNKYSDIVDIPEASIPTTDIVPNTEIDDAIILSFTEPFIDAINSLVDSIEDGDNQAINTMSEAVKLFEAEIKVQRNMEKLRENPMDENRRSAAINSLISFFKKSKSNTIKNTAVLALIVNEITNGENYDKGESETYSQAINAIAKKVDFNDLTTFQINQYTEQFANIYGISIPETLQKSFEIIALNNSQTM